MAAYTYPSTSGASNDSSHSQYNSSSDSNLSLSLPYAEPLGMSDAAISEIVDLSISEEKELYEYYLKKKTHVLFVFHVPEQVVDCQLLGLFTRFGALKATVMTHEQTGRSRGFGFVHFATRYAAQIAINSMDGFRIGVKRLRVTFKKDH